jgi:hypothetical protein
LGLSESCFSKSDSCFSFLSLCGNQGNKFIKTVTVLPLLIREANAKGELDCMHKPNETTPSCKRISATRASGSRNSEISEETLGLIGLPTALAGLLEKIRDSLSYFWIRDHNTLPRSGVLRQIFTPV